MESMGDWINFNNSFLVENTREGGLSLNMGNYFFYTCIMLKGQYTTYTN